MKNIVFLLLVMLFFSCKNPADNYVKRFDRIDIISVNVPDSANLNSIYIRAKAQADNGCWRNLYFELNKTKDFEYTLKAYGTFESFGICSTGIISKDTAIFFRPTELGTYIITTSKKIDEMAVDTMVVVE